ncbi:hypothetical protein Mapa_014179 [Marchantia paleacea]|nr:hypothetical protein Mapa_014179 [Marchantia paleacea]
MGGAVMPPELESGAHVHRNGNSAKSGVNGVSDLPLLATNGKISGQETSGKLNGILDLENQPHQEGKTDEMVSSSSADEEVIQMPRDLNDEATGVSVPSDDVVGNAKAASGASNADAPSIVSDGGRKPSNLSSDWTAAEGNTGWEVAGDESVLGPGPTQEKAADYKATPELYSYWMVKIPRPIDNKGKAEIRMADLRLKDKTEKRDFINAAFQMKRAARAEALDKLRAAREKARACTEAVRSKRDDIEPLQLANKRFREAGRLARDKGRDLPANEEELDQKIKYLEYRIQHESIPLKEEKQLLRDIKNLKACREEVCANAALHAEFAESLGERDEVQQRLSPLIAELETLRAEQNAAYEAIKVAEREFEKADEAVNQIQVQWAAASRARQDAFDERSRLMRQDNARNDEFYQNKRDFQNVRQLAFKKEKKMVEELCNAQVERVLDMWNNNPEFRANYIKSNERSTLKRLSTFDGRSLGPDEEPPLIPGDEDMMAESRTEVGTSHLRKGEAQSKAQSKSSDPKSSGPVSTSDSHKKEGEREIAPTAISNGNVAHTKASPVVTPVPEATKQEQVKVDPAVAAAAAAEEKEKRRQQEMAKAKEAEERKKRMAERSQSKALVRAQKEAEKKEKEKEKRARKKAASGTPLSSHGLRSRVETATEVLEEAEASPEVVVQESHSESKPSSKQRKRAIAAQQKPKTVKPPPVPSSVTKKDAFYQQTWFFILLGMVLLFGLLALMARYVL